MALEKVYDYFHNYDKQTYQVVACMGNEPSEHDIKNFEHQYGINLPADFREFTMSPLGGLYMEVREEIWPRAKQYDIGPFWSFCRGIIVYGIANGIQNERGRYAGGPSSLCFLNCFFFSAFRGECVLTRLYSSLLP